MFYNTVSYIYFIYLFMELCFWQSFKYWTDWIDNIIIVTLIMKLNNRECNRTAICQSINNWTIYEVKCLFLLGTNNYELWELTREPPVRRSRVIYWYVINGWTGWVWWMWSIKVESFYGSWRIYRKKCGK